MDIVWTLPGSLGRNPLFSYFLWSSFSATRSTSFSEYRSSTEDTSSASTTLLLLLWLLLWVLLLLLRLLLWWSELWPSALFGDFSHISVAGVVGRLNWLECKKGSVVIWDWFNVYKDCIDWLILRLYSNSTESVSLRVFDMDCSRWVLLKYGGE